MQDSARARVSPASLKLPPHDLFQGRLFRTQEHVVHLPGQGRGKAVQGLIQFLPVLAVHRQGEVVLGEIGVIAYAHSLLEFRDFGNHLLQLGFGDAEQPQGALGHGAAIPGPLRQAGEHKGVKQGPHFRGHPGQEKKLGIAMPQGEAAGHAFGVQHHRPLGKQGQTAIALQPGNLPLLQEMAEAVQQRLIMQELQPQGLGRGGDGQVIFGGPQAPGDDDEMGAGQRLEQKFLKSGGLIPQDGEALDRQARVMEPAGRITGIKIGHPPGDQLRAGGDDFSLHR